MRIPGLETRALWQLQTWERRLATETGRNPEKQGYEPYSTMQGGALEAAGESAATKQNLKVRIPGLETQALCLRSPSADRELLRSFQTIRELRTDPRSELV